MVSDGEVHHSSKRRSRIDTLFHFISSTRYLPKKHCHILNPVMSRKGLLWLQKTFFGHDNNDRCYIRTLAASQLSRQGNGARWKLCLIDSLFLLLELEPRRSH
ncbi:hypothetical protein AVEN_201457-1 [Araneus ventricosus]|uniref:Uncharacterized protein n=1 Tax=Araneus ventricosus TaxID=182803 RepID=A0A4Y2WNQ7_ARAVE|nr:hypothetical protein AVEN_201457-1 [Araneus ventricosus]